MPAELLTKRNLKKMLAEALEANIFYYIYYNKNQINVF